MGQPRRALVLVLSVLVAGLWAGLHADPSEEATSSRPATAHPAPPPPLVAAGTATVDGRGAVLRPPTEPLAVPWAPGQDCAVLSAPGFVARCGAAGSLVWLTESRTPGTGPGGRASVFRVNPTGGADLVLRTPDVVGLALHEARASV